MIEQPSIRPSAQPTSFDKLTELLEQLNVPDGFRAEIIKGGVFVSPWSKGTYRPVVRSIIRQLTGHEPEGHVIDAAPHLFVFPGHSRSYGPDIHVSDEQATLVDDIHLPGHALSLAAELTSTATADIDRGDKVEVYGKAGVPVYLLVDMLDASLTVYSSPGEEGYRRRTQVSFGETVHVPEPFGCELDTSDWKH
ncbi:Uma2 family endonuclease [Streptomyces sp. 6N223]|uniref:Uma2 family endonuclease n=1 Tax=Streptomyces sp. 6N223 TaxID=3457412 RepID=UPI003FD2A484